MPDRELLVPWLNDAHAMENAFVQLFVNHARRAQEDRPHIHARLSEEVETARRHAQELRECLERLGRGPSVVKAGLGSLVGALEAMSMDLLTNESVHDIVADYAAVQFGIATYRALTVAAEELADRETLRACRGFLSDEEALAAWLELQLPYVAMATIAEDAAPEKKPLPPDQRGARNTG